MNSEGVAGLGRLGTPQATSVSGYIMMGIKEISGNYLLILAKKLEVWGSNISCVCVLEFNETCFLSTETLVVVAMEMSPAEFLELIPDDGTASYFLPHLLTCSQRQVLAWSVHTHTHWILRKHFRRVLRVVFFGQPLWMTQLAVFKLFVWYQAIMYYKHCATKLKGFRVLWWTYLLFDVIEQIQEQACRGCTMWD